MNILKTNRDHAGKNALLIKADKPASSNPIVGIWHWINGIASGIGHFLGGPVTSALRAILVHLDEVVRAIHDVANAYGAMWTWIEQTVLDPIVDRFEREIAQTRARERRDVAHLIRLIYVTAQYVLVTALRAVHAEKVARQRAVGAAETRARLEVRALHHIIEREASSAYRIDSKQRSDLIVRLLEYAAGRNPAVRFLAKDIAGVLLDLLAVDDPPARILLGFLIKHVIDKLGIDKAVGSLIDDLLKPILGEPKPHDLHGVIADLSARLMSVEAQWAKFMEHGGSQVFQAGTDWRNITSLATGAAVTAFTAQAVLAPDAWAKDISNTVGRAANDVAAAAGKLFRG